MKASLVDFHCHLDLFPDMESVIREIEAAAVYTLAVTTTPKAWPRNHELARRTRHVRAALGLHPQLVEERAAEISFWEECLPQARYIGEVGLDAGPRFYRSFPLQKEIFTRILKKCAESEGKILSVHSVRSATNVLNLIEEHFSEDRGKIVLHWFTGSKSEARRAVDLGCYFSINAAMLKTDRGRNLVLSLPQDRLLTETDGPFTQVGNRAARPADVETTIQDLANLRATTPEGLATVIQTNLRVLLKEMQSS